MARDRRIPDSAHHYASDQELLHALLEDPPDFDVWPPAELPALGFTPGQRALVSTWRLDVDVRNAGFGRYFFGLGAAASSASAEALEGLSRFGAEEHHRLLGLAIGRFRGGMPPAPGGEGPEASDPQTEEQYHSAVRHAVFGVAAPGVDGVQARLRAHRLHAEALRRVFGELDDAYRAMERPIERYWLVYVRAHPGDFFAR